ncbi:ATPase [Aureococcus anophagefferens]|nr:ATPase [Aureococcus anophagefferens]
MASVSTKLAQFADGYPPRVATFVIAIVEMVLFLYVAYRLDDPAAALAVPFVDGGWAARTEALDGDVRFERAGALAAARGDHALTLRACVRLRRRAKKRETVAVENLSLRVDAGEIFRLGANGAGKTSAIAVVMRAAFPTAGDAWVCGRSILGDFRAAHLASSRRRTRSTTSVSCREHLDLFLDLRTARQSVASGAARKAVVGVLTASSSARVPDRLAAA